MTKIKLCGMRRPCDIEAANEFLPEYIGFIFAEGSRRRVSVETAKLLKGLLDPRILAVGVFLSQEISYIKELYEGGIIDLAQLHGDEDDAYIEELRAQCPGMEIIKAFKPKSPEEALLAQNSVADYILLDSGAGTGKVFDWDIVGEVSRPYFLAGGLNEKNVGSAIKKLSPFAVDCSTGIEYEGIKDKRKMESFIRQVRKED